MKRFVAVLAGSAVVAAAVMLLSFTIPFQQLDLSAYDFTMRLAGPVAPVLWIRAGGNRAPTCGGIPLW